MTDGQLDRHGCNDGERVESFGRVRSGVLDQRSTVCVAALRLVECLGVDERCQYGRRCSVSEAMRTS